jgi:hypothetical protein
MPMGLATLARVTITNYFVSNVIIYRRMADEYQTEKGKDV